MSAAILPVASTLPSQYRFSKLIAQHKGIFIAALVCVAALFTLYTVCFYIPLYQSDVSLYVRNLPQNDVVDTYRAPNPVTSESGYSNPLFNLVEVIKSNEVGEQLYTLLKQRYPEHLQAMHVQTREQWHVKYQKLLSASIKPSTDIIEVSLKWSDAKQAPEVLSILVQEFKSVNVNLQRSIIAHQRKNLEQELNVIGQDLDKVRSQIRAYKIANQAGNFDNEIMSLSAARLDLERQASLIKSQRAYAMQKSSLLSKTIGMGSPTQALRATGIGQDPYMIKMNQDLAAEQQEFNKLSAKFTDQHPDVIAQRSRVQAVEDSLTQRRLETLSGTRLSGAPAEKSVRPLYDLSSQNIAEEFARTHADIAAYNQQALDLQHSIAQVKSREAAVPTIMAGLQDLQKQEPALEEAYTNTKRKYLEAVINERNVLDNIEILGSPTPGSGSNRELLLVGLGMLLAGILIPTAVVWVKAGLEDRWVDALEMQSVTQLPVLGLMPWLTCPPQHERAQPLPQLYGDAQMLEHACASLVNRLVSAAQAQQAQVISFVSADPSRKHSLIVPYMALSLSRAGKSVLLVDGHFDAPLLTELTPVLTESASLDEATGADTSAQTSLVSQDLLSLLRTLQRTLKPFEVNNNRYRGVPAQLYPRLTQDILQTLIEVQVSERQTEFSSGMSSPMSSTGAAAAAPTFHVLGARQAYPDQYHWLTSPAFIWLIQVLRHQFDYVLIDAAPSDSLPIALACMPAVADGVVLINGHATRRQTLLDSVHTVEAQNLTVLGIIARDTPGALAFDSQSERITAGVTPQTRVRVAAEASVA